MIKTDDFGPVRRFKLSNTIFGKALYYTSAWWVDGLMIDSGCAHTSTELMNALDDTPVSVLVNTHGHEDHVGANRAISELYNITPLAHPLALPALNTPPKNQPQMLYQRILFGRYEPYPGLSVGTKIETDHYNFEMIHTPGHSPDHLSLFEPTEGWLFCGDSYVGGKDRNLRMGCNIYKIIDSLKKIAQLKPTIMFTGSGSVRKTPVDDLMAKIDYLEETGQKIREMANQGVSRKQIASTVFGPHQWITYTTAFTFSSDLLVNSYLDDQDCLTP